jgi:RHS repeat-associated protein
MVMPKKFSRFSAYSVYGYSPNRLGLLNFNGEKIDQVSGLYILGNGYRAYNASLMRFNSSDSMSPFSAGGMNAYAYCCGDPVNFQDPAGRSRIGRFFAGLFGDSSKVPKGYSLIGYHGGALEDKNSLEAGLSSKFFYRSSGRAVLGEGFYFASKFQVAAEYAGYAADRGLTPHVYGVYAKKQSFLNFRKGKGISGNYVRSEYTMRVGSSLFGKVVVRAEVRMPIVRRDSFRLQEESDKAMEIRQQGTVPAP